MKLSLIVFDCDMCLWSPEMYTLRSLPSEKILGEISPGVQGVIGAKNAEGEIVKLFPGALKALQAYDEGSLGQEVRIAAASSADTPFAVKCALASMDLLEISPGKTMRQVFNKGFSKGFKGNLQIGRSGHLSSNKTTHFNALKKETGIAFSEMLFFDDCNWGDNCATVRKSCHGVQTIKTPNGLTWDLFQEGLNKFVS